MQLVHGWEPKQVVYRITDNPKAVPTAASRYDGMGPRWTPFPEEKQGRPFFYTTKKISLVPGPSNVLSKFDNKRHDRTKRVVNPAKNEDRIAPWRKRRELSSDNDDDMDQRHGRTKRVVNPAKNEDRIAPRRKRGELSSDNDDDMDRAHRWKENEKARFPYEPDDDFPPDASDDDNEDGNEISDELQAYLNDTRP